MENKENKNFKKDAAAMVDGWLDDIMDRINALGIIEEQEPDEIGPDEQAVASAGLIHPDDAELERIVQETIAENWGDELGIDAPAEDDGTGTQLFSSVSAQEAQEEISQYEEDEPEAEEEEPEAINEAISDALVRKLRPKAKKGYGLWGIPHIISTVIWLCIILTIGISLGRLVWVCAADVLALGKTGQEITVTIDVEDRLPDIAEKLEKAGMIRYAGLFETFAKLTGKGDNILVGSITFRENMVYDYNALINAMSYKGGSMVTVEVMIPEGYSCAQIFALLEEKGVCSIEELEEYAASGELESYWFLDGVERNHKYCLEGFLFPDTYEFYMNDEPQRVLEKFLKNFEHRFSSRMIDKFVALNQKTGLNLTIRDVVTMASIIEKEKANNLEGYTIASVFYNRLTHASSYPFLNSDATILYATEYYSKGELVTDAQINASPYNTYTQKGLPAGPIANPGLSSLDAALEPEDTAYYFFIFDKSAGVHRFSKTLAEHNALASQLGY